MQSERLNTPKRQPSPELSLLAANVLRLRKELGWSTRAFAEHAGVSRSFLARVEQGSLRTVSLTTVERLAKGFGVNPATMLSVPRQKRLALCEDALSRVVASVVVSRRLLANWTQEELAVKAAVGRSHLAEIETGEQNVSLDVLSRLADALGCPLTSLLVHDEPL